MNYRYKQLEQELSTLKEVFTELGARLSEVAKEVTSPGVMPSEVLLEQISASRTSFENVRSAIHGHAGAMLISPLPGLRELGSIATIDSLLKASAIAEEGKFSIEGERERVLSILGRALTIAHRETAEFKPLQECHAKIGELRSAVTNVIWPQRHPESELIVESKHPVTALLAFIEMLDRLDDERWMALETTITESYGKALFVAASRGKLTVNPEAKPDGAPPVAKPVASVSTKASSAPPPEAAKLAAAAEKAATEKAIAEKAVAEKAAAEKAIAEKAAAEKAAAEKAASEKVAAEKVAAAEKPVEKKPVQEKVPEKPVASPVPPTPVAAAPVEKKPAAPATAHPATQTERVPQKPTAPVVSAPAAPAPVQPAAMVTEKRPSAPAPTIPAAIPAPPMPSASPASFASAPPAVAPSAPAVSSTPPAGPPAQVTAPSRPSAAASIASSPTPTMTTPVPAASNTPPASPLTVNMNSLSALANATETPEKKPASVPVDTLDKQRKEPRLAAVPPAQPQSISIPEFKPQELPENPQQGLTGDGQRPQRWGFWRGNR